MNGIKKEKMSSNKDFQETKGILVTLILEIIGRPPEHLVETLNKIIDEMDNEKNVKVKSKKINEPVLIKDQEDMYTTFAEIDVEVETIQNLAILIYKYMPAHIEIINPEIIALSNSGWNDIFNELTRRLHGYDEVARVLMMERAMIEKKLKESLTQQNSSVPAPIIADEVSNSTKEKPAKKTRKKK